MAKCIRCGKGGMGILHQAIKLKDKNYVCFKCYKELGFSPKEDIMTAPYTYTWDDIKNGKDAYVRSMISEKSVAYDTAQSDRLGLFYADYSTLEALDCSDYEMRTVERICALLEDEGCRTRRISYERDPGAPLSAYVGDKKLFELKYTNDVKWIRIGDSDDKNRITGPAGINKLVDKLVEAYKR